MGAVEVPAVVTASGDQSRPRHQRACARTIAAPLRHNAVGVAQGTITNEIALHNTCACNRAKHLEYFFFWRCLFGGEAQAIFGGGRLLASLPARDATAHAHARPGRLRRPRLAQHVGGAIRGLHGRLHVPYW